MDLQFDESQSFKRNLRFSRMQGQSNLQEGNFQFLSKIFNSEQNQQRKVSSLVFSQSSFQLNSYPFQRQSFVRSRNESYHQQKSKQEKEVVQTVIQNSRKKSIQSHVKSQIKSQKLTFSNKKQILFENLIISLITNFNPSMVKSQHLFRLNQNFSVFNRILKEDNKDSILIYGVSSTGKSSSVDWALRNNKNYQKLTIDCLEFDSQVSFIFKLNELLKNFFEIKSTMDIDYDQFTRKSLFTMLEPFVHKSHKKAILVIQNAQFLVKFTAHKVIYNLAELASNCRKNIKIILITRLPNFIKSLDRRQKSRLKLVPIQFLKVRQSIIHIFQQRFNCVEKQLMTAKNSLFFTNQNKNEKQKFQKLQKQWFQKICSLFCQNQSLKRQLQLLSKGIQNHLNAACWIMAHMLHLQRIQDSSQTELQQQMIHFYKLFMNNAHPLPSKNLLQNANLDQKIFMSLVYSMFTNDRKPYSFNTILRLSYEFKAQKVQKTYSIYLSEMNLKKAYLKLIDKKIIYFEEGENDQVDREIKVSMNFLDIRDAIIRDGQAQQQDLPYFVKEVLCL